MFTLISGKINACIRLQQGRRRHSSHSGHGRTTFQPLFLYILESIRFIIYQKHFSSVNFGFRLHQGLVPEALNSKISWRSMPPDPPRVFWSMT